MNEDQSKNGIERKKGRGGEGSESTECNGLQHLEVKRQRATGGGQDK